MVPGNLGRGNKIFFGLTASEALSYFKSTYDLGTQNKAYYLVSLTPYENNATAKLPLLANNLAGILANDVDIPVNGANFEQKKVGGMMISVFTDMQFPQFTVNLLETRKNDVLNSLRQYRELVVNRDGTVNEPAKYAMIFSFAFFDSSLGRDIQWYQDKFLVAMSLESLQGASAKDPTPSEIPVVFSVLDPYLV
ncbi:hypothetical protein [Acinetobacter colistiniresistens]|uniref:hypothetical protein n=1 Tax=Acinetobacter colistiniresistens TaxID=280145 RepID=UPI0012509CE9|nr:hypothetical protein [Acinetobacter colistiniresistens]